MQEDMGKFSLTLLVEKRDGGWLFYIYDPTASTKNTSKRARVLPLLVAASPL
jgi:hypothetical protein